MSLLSYLTGGSKNNFYYDIKKILTFSHRTHYESDKSKDSSNVNTYVAKLHHTEDFIAATVGAYEMGVSATMANIQSRTGLTEFDRDFEGFIADWSQSPETSGRFFRGDLEQAEVREFAVLSGGYLEVDHFSKSFEFGYKVEFVNLNAVDQTENDFSKNIYYGIKTSKRFGKITAIKVFTDNSRTKSVWIPYARCRLVINRWASTEQYNGIAPVAPILKGLKYTKEYHDEEMNSAKRRSRNNVLIKSPYFSEMLNKALKVLKGKSAIDAYEEAFNSRRVDGDNVNGVRYIDENEEPIELGRGVDNPYQDIMRNKTRAMSAAVRLSPMLTVGEMPSSYNAMLYFHQKDENVFGSVHQKLVWLSWRPRTEKLLQGLVLVGKLKLPDFWENPKKYQKLELMRRGIGHIDPVKQQKALSEGLTNGTLNPIEVQAKRGVDYEAHIQATVDYEIKKKELFENAGLQYVQSGFESLLTPEDLINEDDK